MSNINSILTDFLQLCNTELFYDIFEYLSDIVLFVDRDGKIVYVNKAYTEIVGVLPEKILGRNLIDIEPHSPILKVLETGEIFQKFNYSESLDINLFGITVPVFNNHTEKKVIGAISIFNNVAKLKAMTKKYERAQEMTEYLREQLKEQQLPQSFQEILCQSSSMKDVLRFSAKLAKTESTILIRGESGVGKGVLAHAIHAASDRKNENFVKVNCASIPDSLLESELFGYEDGAFTGAKKGGKIGKFELAHEGTIFLDEIGDMDFEMQAKLLRVIQEKEIERVGGVKSIPLNVRIIAATNKNLEKMIEENKFRSDLYYRLNVVPIYIPPLRERKGVIIPLARYFIEKLNGNDNIGLSYETIKTMLSYPWPGNIRELQNVVEYANILRTSRFIEVGDLPKYMRATADNSELAVDDENRLNLKNATALLEKELIVEALNASGGNKSIAIKILGISRRSFYEKLTRYGLGS